MTEIDAALKNLPSGMRVGPGIMEMAEPSADTDLDAHSRPGMSLLAPCQTLLWGYWDECKDCLVCICVCNYPVYIIWRLFLVMRPIWKVNGPHRWRGRWLTRVSEVRKVTLSLFIKYYIRQCRLLALHPRRCYIRRSPHEYGRVDALIESVILTAGK